MPLTNTVKPSSPSLTNSTRPSFAELWSTITTTWAAETRTWAATASLMTNSADVTASITNTVKPS